MTTAAEDPRKRVEYIDVDIVVTEHNTTLPERLKGYKPFIGVPKKPAVPDATDKPAGVPPEEEP